MTEARPKLLLFTHLCSSAFVSGAEKLLMLFIRQMTGRFECVLVVPGEGLIAAQARMLGIRVEVLEIPLCVSLYTAHHRLADDIHAMKKLFVYQRLLALLARERPSCVWANTSVHPLPAIAAKSLGIPTVWAVMETIMPTEHRHVSVHVIASASDIIAGISLTTLLPFKHGPGEQKSVLLPPYIDRAELEPGSWPAYRNELRQRFGWNEENPVVGYIAATIYENKGLEHFVQAAVRVSNANPAVRFLVVGNPVDDVYFYKCRMAAAESGIADRFGWLLFEEHIQRVYPAMDVVAVPSLVPEGFGMTALEGLLFGKPVVAYASGGLAEILAATGNEMFLVGTGDVGSFTARLELLVNDRPMREAIGQSNEQAALAVFGVEAFRYHLERLIERLPIRSERRAPLVRASGKKTVYLLENRRRRPFESEKALLQRGFRFTDVVVVMGRQLRDYRMGDPIQELSQAGTRRKSKSRRRRHRTRRRERTSSRAAYTRRSRRRPHRRAIRSRRRMIRKKRQKRR